MKKITLGLLSIFATSSLFAGTYSVDFNASTFSSGIYFYKIETNGFSSVKKMMLIK